MADWVSVMEPGIDEKPGIAGRAIKEYVVVAVTVTELFVLDSGELAVAVTLSVPASA